MQMNLRCLTLVLLLLAGPAAADERASKLDNDVRYLVGRYAHLMHTAVAIVHPASSGRVEVNAASAYPLASVFKVPLMTKVVDSLAQGEFSASTNLVIQEGFKCIGSGRLQKSSNGSSVSVDRLLRLMMSISDNTATDLLFHKVGVDAVDAYMHKLGLSSSQIYMPNREAWLLSLGKAPGLEGLGPGARAQRWLSWELSQRKKLAAQVGKLYRNLTLAEFQAIEDASARQNSAQEDAVVAAAMDNLCSASDLAKLLERLSQGQLYQDERWSRYCFELLEGQQYHTRLPARIPSEVPIYHKTGTLAGIRNDAGVIVLPSGEHLVVVVLCQKIRSGAESKADGLIAEIARQAYLAYR